MEPPEHIAAVPVIETVGVVVTVTVRIAGDEEQIPLVPVNV